MQRNSGLLVSVEPDASVWNLLDENRRTHNCDFWLLRGVISDRPAVAAAAEGVGYATRAEDAPLVAPSAFNSREHYTLRQIQQTLNMTFTALLIDCEGCIGALFRDEPPAHTASAAVAAAAPAAARGGRAAGGRAQAVAEPLPALPELMALLREVRTVILEGDMAVGARDCAFNCVDYSLWERRLNAVGLRTVHKEQDPVYPAIFHFVFQRNAEGSSL